MALLLALASSLLWGLADFLGGSASKRTSSLLVVVISQFAGLVAALIAAAGTGSFSAPTGYVPWAVCAGVAGTSAVVLYYRALAIGTMGVVAPLAALGAIVPVVIALIGGDFPSTLCLAGIVVAICGVFIAAGPRRSGSRTSRHTQAILLAIGSAVGFGLLQYAISVSSKYSTVMTMVIMRAISVPALAIIAFVVLRAQHTSRRRDEHALSLSYGWIGLVIVIGVLDVGSNFLFAVATVSGALAIVAVLGSLSPAAVVLLARFINHERMSRVQNIGVLAAVIGVAMITVGS